MDVVFVPLTLAAAVGSAVVGGMFYAFSTFVMAALGRLPTREGVAAMRSINVVVINPLFLGLFLGTAALSAAAGGLALTRSSAAGAIWALTGALLYLVGAFGVTIAFNVRLNNALARVDPSDADVGDVWADYRNRWTTWNHVRTAAAIAAAIAFILALRG